MTQISTKLADIFLGWDGYQTSIVHAIDPLTPNQLQWRPGPRFRSVGELASHIALGRVDWFVRMPAPGSQELAQKAAALASENVIAGDRDAILTWLNSTWNMIANTLNQFSVADLARTYRHQYHGKVYSVSYQWTIWRIMTHDIHHGGELALMLGMQGIDVPELGDLFGHLTEPPLAD